MDKTPKERIVFDEGVYYGDEGTAISIEDIKSREGITEEEVLESYTEEEIFENAMTMMDIDRTEELDGLRAFLDGSDNPLSSYDNPLGGNRIIARGSIGRWDGTRHGMAAYKDFDDMMGGTDSVFKDCEIGKVWDENGSLFIHGYHHDGGVDVEVRQLTDAGEEALDAIEDAWVGEPFTSGGKEYDGSPESMSDAMRDLWENPDLCPTPRYMELAFGCPAEEYEAPAIDPLLEAAEFSPSAIMSAEVAPGTASATVHDVSGVPYEVPADVLNGLKDAVRTADRAGTIAPSASLTITEWNQKLDDSLWALDFEDRNGVPPQLSDWLARNAEGEKGDESAKANPVNLKTAAKEAREASAALSVHEAPTVDLEHEAMASEKETAVPKTDLNLICNAVRGDLEDKRIQTFDRPDGKMGFRVFIAYKQDVLDAVEKRFPGHVPHDLGIEFIHPERYKEERERRMIPGELHVPSRMARENDDRYGPSLTEAIAESRAASAAIGKDMAPRFERERDTR